MNTFNSLDYLILTIIILSTLFGLWRGFIRSFFSLIVWGAIALTLFYFSGNIAAFFAAFTTNAALQLVCAYVSLLLGGFLINWIIRLMVESFMSDADISFTNHFFGGILGLVRGALLVTLLAFSIQFTASNNMAAMRESTLLPSFNKALTNVTALFKGRPLASRASGRHL